MENTNIQFPQLIKVGCGIDVHQNLMVATIRKSNETYETRNFEGYTSSLTALRAWCKSEGVTHVAMESTGVYWKPVFNILEDDFEIILVNARHVKNVPGHKTDKKDSAWLSKLLLSGLLKASFIPKQDIRELRDLVRYKKKVVSDAAGDKNRIIKILEDANIKLSSVLSNVDGAVGSKIIADIIDGKHNPDELLKYYHGKMKASKETLKKSLEGRITKHHQFMLKLLKQSITDKENLIMTLDAQIDEASKEYAVEIELLQTIPGVGKASAVSILSEVGGDMEVFATEHHLSSWAGMSPGNNESGGKKKVPKPSTETNTFNPH
jgi:transposase